MDDAEQSQWTNGLKENSEGILLESLFKTDPILTFYFLCSIFFIVVFLFSIHSPFNVLSQRLWMCMEPFHNHPIWVFLPTVL